MSLKTGQILQTTSLVRVISNFDDIFEHFTIFGNDLKCRFNFSSFLISR